MVPPPPLTQDTNALLKLHLGDKGTRRIAFRKLWNSDSDTVSFQSLADLAIQYSGCQAEDVLEVTITYIDEDGDTITISSDEELAEAFEQFVDKVPPVVRASAKVKAPGLEEPAKPISPTSMLQRKIDPNVGNGKFRGERKKCKDMRRKHFLEMQALRVRAKAVRVEQMEQEAKERKQMEHGTQTCGTFMMNLPPTTKTSVDSLPKNQSRSKPQPQKDSIEEQEQSPFTQGMITESPAVPLPITEPIVKAEAEPKKMKIPMSFDPNFIHGRHTCDGCFVTPIIGYRFNATNRADYDVCHKCYSQYQGTETRFAPQQLERDAHLQQRWHNRQMRLSNRNTRQGRGNGHVHVRSHKGNPSSQIKNAKATGFKGSDLDEAIRRSLISVKEKVSTGIQNIKTEKEIVRKVPVPTQNKEVQEPKDEKEGIQETKEEKSLANPVNEIEVLIAKMIHDPADESDRIGVGISATAAAIAVAKILQNCQTSDSQESNNKEEAGSLKKSTDDDIDAASLTLMQAKDLVDAYDKDVASHMSLVQAEAKFDAASKDEVDIVVSPTCSAQITIEPIDTLVLQIEKPQLESSTSSDSGEMILDGDEDNEDDLSEGTESTSSNCSWEVVNEDGKMMAQAAQMLGSALFQSDANVASSDNNVDDEVLGNSVLSGLTSVPSITTTKSEIAAVLLNRWEDELRQLHELGFLDDHANVEALGHLEAANIGVDSDDAIKVEQVVDFLLQGQK